MTALMPWAGEHYGCRVVDLGDDGDLWAVAGGREAEHVTDRRALAAVLHYLRADCGFGTDDMEFGEVKVQRRWVTLTGDDDEPWAWADDAAPGSWAVSLVESW